ncbi:MAG: hypothetical protein AB7O43_13795, partial [Hyphomicrobiaceae bacterium]
ATAVDAGAGARPAGGAGSGMTAAAGHREVRKSVARAATPTRRHHGKVTAAKSSADLSAVFRDQVPR